ncbi:MAG: hypothetical protein EWM45_10920 [Rhodopseudomonas palustris]|nr:MAG: hypothetical protein EWM45_10920 [Rhodopseudomonas palustris]
MISNFRWNHPTVRHVASTYRCEAFETTAMMITATTKTAKLVFGAAALAISFGVAQLAAGSDLRQPLQVDQRAELATPPSMAVNRAAKADRVTMGVIAPGLTFAVRPIDTAASSYLVRIPVVSGEAARPAPTRPAQIPAGKPMVACEPVVSVLTDIARQLPPGRCVT